MQRLQISITNEQLKWLKKESYEKDISIAEIIRELLNIRIKEG